MKAHRATLKARVLVLLGSVCIRCGFSDIRALQIDHINGGGMKQKRLRGTHGLYLDILSAGGKGYQILCANCNWIKRHEEAEAPHG